MKPVNNKSLLTFVFDQMEKLDQGTINVDTAREQANLIKQSSNLLKYELDRTKVQMKLAEHNAIYKDGLRIREIESKNFDETDH